MQTLKQKEWYLKNKQLCVDRAKLWKKNNPEKLKKSVKKYYERNKKAIFARNKIYKKAHYIKRPRKSKDLVGIKFKRLKVLSLSHISKRRDRFWNCVCDCGAKVTVSGISLFHNRSKSCGCLHKELVRKMCKERTGTKNPGWKGDSARYRTIHTWLDNNFKFKKEKCDHCKKIIKALDFALLKGKQHSHNVKNYIILCRKCHVKYDEIYERRKKNTS